ncbi:MAG: hypothetical protein AAGD13_22215 [Pseudomonadota bacterium]
MTDKKAPELLSETDLDSVDGGYMKIGDIAGERVVNSFETIGKRDIGTGARSGGDTVPVDTLTINFGKIDVE